MFHENDIQHVVNLVYQFDTTELAFMITKTLFTRCYTIKCDLSLWRLQHKIMHYSIALTHNALSQRNIKRTNLPHIIFII